MRIAGIIFDKDGTLFDFHATWSRWAREVAAELAGGDAALRAGIDDALGWDSALGRLRPDSVVVAETPDAVADALAAVLPRANRRRLLDRLIALAAAAPQVEAAPLLPLMEELRARGLHLACVTNDAEAVARAHLRRAEVETRFDLILGYDSGHGAKPDPAPFRATAGRLGLRPRETLVVGDSLHDLVAGRAAGMRTVAVTTGAQPAQVLAPHAEAVLAHVGELPAWLDG